MSKEQIFLFQWDYMINCTENDNGNGKLDHINKTYIDLEVETNVQNIAFLLKTMSLCNKQQLSNIWGSVH